MWNQLKSGFQLVRGGNLIIIALAMSFFHYFKVIPALNAVSLNPALNGFYFSLLVLAVVSIAAAGYIMNAYFSFENDRLLAPERTLIGTFISLDNAFILQGALNITGIVLAYFLAWKTGNYKLGNLFVVAVALLCVYGMFLKHWFLIGDLVISVLHAFVFVIVVVYEPQVFSSYLAETYPQEIGHLFYQMEGYALFAFTLAFILELVDGMRNKSIDKQAGAKTLAVLFPEWAGKTVIILVTSTAFVLLGFLSYVFFVNGATKQFWYITLLMQSHFLIVIFLTVAADKPVDYHNNGIFAKLILLYGIFSLPVFWLFNV